MHYLTDAHIPYSRLHDVAGAFGRQSVRRYNRTYSATFRLTRTAPRATTSRSTDLLLADLAKAKCEPIFRLGVTIENYQHIRAYRIFPPADFEKWAKICEHIVRHYNEGWASGFHYDIKYWEIWNEPDNGESDENNMMWRGHARAVL